MAERQLPVCHRADPNRYNLEHNNKDKRLINHLFEDHESVNLETICANPLSKHNEQNARFAEKNEQGEGSQDVSITDMEIIDQALGKDITFFLAIEDLAIAQCSIATIKKRIRRIRFS